MEEKRENSRRNFIANTAMGTVATIGAANLLLACGSSGNKSATKSTSAATAGIAPVLLDKAPDGKVLRAGLVGCGGRGTGAAMNFLDAGPNLQLVAMGDVFTDKLADSRAQLKKQRNIEVPDEKCFVGFDAYQKVLDAGIDIVLLCTPPHFRPAHVEAAVNAGKHIFMEKPCAVDPVGARSILVSAKKAEQLGLSIVSGTIRRVQKDYVETHRRVAAGEIGEIVSAHVVRNGGGVWVKKRKPEWTDMEYMLRNWVNFTWLSGDHIVEQFIHEVDVMNWHIGKNPVKCMGWGGRQRRVTGDQYDFFSVEYIYENGMQAHCAARQIRGCSNLKREVIVGTKGYADANGTLFHPDGTVMWKYPYPKDGDTDLTWKMKDPYVQEHVNLVTAIRTGKVFSDAEAQVNSTLITMMGRISAYTGKDVSWDEMMNSGLSLGPKVYAFGPVAGIPEEIPVIGFAAVPA